MSSTSLTQHLLSQHPSRLRSATNHPFLSRAGAGTLSPSPLCKWLVQDKHYQFAYVQFIGRLISKIDLAPSSGSSTQRTADDKNLDWKTLNTLLAALSAIKSEIEFYDETVSKYDLEIHMEGPDEVTRQYQRLFEESSAAGQPVLRGLVVLWATEHVCDPISCWRLLAPSPTLDSKRGVTYLAARTFSLSGSVNTDGVG